MITFQQNTARIKPKMAEASASVCLILATALTASRDHSPLTHKVVLVGNGSRWDCIFSRTIIIFVGPDLFLAGRSAYLIFMDYFLSFLGNH